MSDEQRYVIVGASLAGAKAAETLRGEGFDGHVTLIGDETERPYERPPLSKEYLLGKAERDKVFVHDEAWYADNQVELRLGSMVTRIDRGGRRVELAGGDFCRYDKLLLTTGASPRRLNVPGAELDGVLYLRTIDESRRLAEAFKGGGRVVVVGGGWIGMETAAAAREYGCDVTVVETERTPLHLAMGPELGGLFADVHRRHGVEFLLGAGVTGFNGGTGDAGTVRAVVTGDGGELPADVVVVGIGARPNTALAEGAGLDVDNGVLVDSSLRTSDPDIYAAGDVVNAQHPLYGRRIRVEHWSNALNGGPAAARSMLGHDVVYDRVPYFFSDQFEIGMETSGLPTPGEYDHVVYRGDPASLEFIAFWLTGRRVVAGMNVNVWDVTGDIQALIRSGAQVDTARLTDPDIPLADV